MRTVIGLSVFMMVLISVSYCVSEPEIKGGNMPEIKKLTVTSTAFKEGETIPRQYTCDGDDISPALSWQGVPKEAKELALICDDPDAPGGVWTHWTIYGISPDITGLDSNIVKKDSIKIGNQGRTSFGKVGYGGPCPPPGKPHRYYFRLYALDKQLGLKPGISRIEFEQAMKGHIIAQGELMGRYGR